MTDAERAGYRQALEDASCEMIAHPYHTMRDILEELRAALDAVPAAPEDQHGKETEAEDGKMPAVRKEVQERRDDPEPVSMVRRDIPSGVASPASPGERGETLRCDRYFHLPNGCAVKEQPRSHWCIGCSTNERIKRLLAELNAAEQHVKILHEAQENHGREIARLRAALEESVDCQSYYAKLLNIHDRGQRPTFADADAWLARLAQRDALAPPAVGGTDA